ncbi:hypothetical protein [Polyangium sorediatum]|uniref:Uncharacterized protein n=1 Tax=Polyangium sorediatum TaxID=889274 RepID=A0ABT6NXI7_9BACT|nr:hypothetical protein [Polyangium sorediatum]MDI1433065.1 hypothetical protein [Polyangium sorediatum]
MKKLFGLMAAAALVVSAGAVMAEEGAQQQPQQGAAQQPQQPQHQQMQQRKEQAKQQAAQKMAEAGIGRHQMTGRIVDINKEKGELKVETERGQLEFNFPPASLQNYKEGDQVRLDVVIRPAQQQQPAPQPKQEHPQQKQ